MRGDPRLPLYARLRDELASKVASQTWSAGTSIPPEHELASENGVSVHTVRKAVDQLVTEGLLERRQGSGTYVRRPSFDGSLFRWFNFEDASAGGRIVPESRLLSRELLEMPAEVKDKFGPDATDKTVRVLRLRLWSKVPIVLEEIFLPYPRYADFFDMNEADIGPLLYPVYEQHFGDFVTSVEDEISIGFANDTVAQHLGVGLNDPTIVVERSTLAVDGRTIEWRRAHGRADRFRYKVSLK